MSLFDQHTATEVQARIAEAEPRLFEMIRVFESSILLPRRVHKRKRWMSASYHCRIQKKWDKRFGKGLVAFLINSGHLNLAMPKFAVEIKAKP